MRKIARICKRIKRREGLQFAVIRRRRRYYLYFFDPFRGDWFLDCWADSLSEVESLLIHHEGYLNPEVIK